MANSLDEPIGPIAQFHRLVEEGTEEDLRAALRQVSDVNAPGRRGTTALLIAITAGDAEKMHLLLQAGADPELADDFNTTPLRCAVQENYVDGVRLLLSLGVDRGSNPKYPLKKIDFDHLWPKIPMPKEMQGVLTDEEWNESLRMTRKSIREIGLNPASEPIIVDAQSVEVLRLLLEAGDDLQAASPEMKRAYLGLQTGGSIECTAADYRRHRTPRYGLSNPERMDNPFWDAMIRAGEIAYAARAQFGETTRFGEPVWCFSRFGSSLTPISGGRFVQIGGEHEDFYDPDFCIYNDVVVHDGRGGFAIYGYPEEVFSATDFHSATLVDDVIYVIGCLGYADKRREGFTPVFRLRLDSWRIEPVETSGEMPGWIFKHRAEHRPAERAIRLSGGERHVLNQEGEADVAPNEGQFELDLSTFRWRQVV